MRQLLIVAIVLAAPRISHGGGFEIAEQSPQGIATVGAQTAVAEDAAAVYYNPAGLAFQPGFGALAGGQLAYVDTRVSAGETIRTNHTGVAPTLFGSQRLGKHFAIGIGSYANFAEHFKYPQDWSGRFLGSFVDVTTATINPVLAYRPIQRLSLAVGLSIVPGSVDIYQSANFGGGEGVIHAGLTGIGAGATAGLMAEIIPYYLRFGFAYRSRVDIDFTGLSSITAPPEVQGAVAGLFNARTTLPLPHNLTWAISSRPIDRLTLSADVRYTLWSDISTLVLTQTSQQNPGMTVENRVVTNLRNSWGVRFGGELRVLENRVRLRAGIGWDQTPVPRETLGPLIPDTDRMLVGGGLGYHSNRWSLQAGYLAAILFESTSENPDLRATYSTVGHVVSAAFTLRFANFGGRLAANEIAWSDTATPKLEERRMARR
jgi:long-chain fatty acid transport protein